MNRKTLIKTVLILAAAPCLAAIMIIVGGAGLAASSFLLLVQAMDWAEERPDQIIFINESSTELSAVEITGGIECFERYELKGTDEITVEWELWPCEVAVIDTNGQVVEQLRIQEDPYEDLEQDRWYVIAQDGREGVILTLSHVRDLEEVLEWGSETSGLALSDGVIQQFIYRHGSFGDGDSLLVMTFSPEQGAALERAMAQTEGWHKFPTHELLNRIFFMDRGYCRDLAGENYVPNVENGWYFFRDTYNVQHGENDERQWVLEGRTVLPGNFDAGIYDSDSQTLYLYEFDS